MQKRVLSVKNAVQSELEFGLRMRIDILSLFPGYFQGPFSESILKRACEKGLLTIRLIDIRDFAQGRHRQVDDRPYGGGPGMVMMAEPIVKAVHSVQEEETHVVYMTPQGVPLTAAKCRELSSYRHLVILSGHYEGIDERAMTVVHEEISIGNYVLTDGCAAAIVVVNALARFIPGVLGHPDSANADSFEAEGILDYPHYTRPENFKGMRVPEVLLSGNHNQIAKWRRDAALHKTKIVKELTDEQGKSNPTAREQTAQNRYP